MSFSKRCIFIGSVEYSSHCLKTLLEMGVNIVDIMCPVRDVSAFNSDYLDLGKVARDFGREVSYFRKIGDEVEHIRERKPDLIFTLGFSQLVSREILEIPTIGCIGSHPALLPQNRGRHPVIWAIANGLKKSGITLFWMDRGVDSGDIWLQKEFEIGEMDTAATVYKMITNLSCILLRENVLDLERGIIKRIKQDESIATYWRKRSAKDGEIDWRMSSQRIYDLVRALTRPYVGAHCMYKGREVKIWGTKIIDAMDSLANFEPGKVLQVEGTRMRVKTGDGVIEILAHDFEPLPSEGNYL